MQTKRNIFVKYTSFGATQTSFSVRLLTRLQVSQNTSRIVNWTLYSKNEFNVLKSAVEHKQAFALVTRNVRDNDPQFTFHHI